MLIFDTLPGLVIGIITSMTLLLYRVSRPHVAVLGRLGPAWVDISRHPDLTTDPTVLVVRVEAGLFFANTDAVRDQISALVTPATRIVVLDAQTTPFVDVTAAQMLAELATTLRRSRIELRIAQDIGQVRDVIGQTVPEAFAHQVFATIDDAITAPGNEPPNRHT